MFTTPTLYLDWAKAARNLIDIRDRAQRHGLLFRPHFKTLQSRAIGRKCREFGVKAITVSSVSMAEYFAEDGWDDITIAFPANSLEAMAIDRLAAKVKLNLLVVNPETVGLLLEGGLSHPVGVFVKIDVGTRRTGIDPTHEAALEAVLTAIDGAKLMTFRGFLAHAGHSYAARSEAEIQQVHDSSTAILRKLKEKYRSRYPGLILSPGDTPTCSVAENWEGMDEMRPGNFIFYDLMQVQIGSCRMEDIAVAVACPVVAKHADRQELIIYGGGIHLSKDRLDWEGKTIFGMPVELEPGGWKMPEPGCYIRSLSQEHGVISCSASFFEKMKIGSMVGILPVHSCMAVDLLDHYVDTDGEVWDVM